jgi:CRISPR/Cas system-associated exonuclease Cas4 (RecB family)
MRDLETNLHEILRDDSRLQRLLALEKKRRGAPKDALVFVGMADVATHWWCTQQAVLKSRAIEQGVFEAYLHDRILYAHRLGIISKLPTRDGVLLDAGKEITLADVDKLLREEGQKAEERAKLLAGTRARWVSEDRVDSAGARTRLINPDLPPEEREFQEEQAVEEGVRVIDLAEDPKLRGRVYQRIRAERYPTIRWNFCWDRYVVVGVPDGIGKDLVYEYKTTRTRSLIPFMKPVAMAQADLYGHFFRRPKKRVQVLVVDENITQTYEEMVSASHAEDTLAAFARVDAGQPARPPKPWKCRKCEFRATCPISQAK